MISKSVKIDLITMARSVPCWPMFSIALPCRCVAPKMCRALLASTTPRGEGGHGQQQFARPIEGIACFADLMGFNGT